MQQTIKLKILGKVLEIETKLNTDIKFVKDIKIPEGWALLELSEFLEIWNNHNDKFSFDGDEFDEIVKQPIKELVGKYPYFNVWFRGLGYSYLSGLNCNNRNLLGDDRVWGVRFCREVK